MYDIHTYIHTHTFLFGDLHWHREHFYWWILHEYAATVLRVNSERLSFQVRLSFWLQLTYLYDQMINILGWRDRKSNYRPLASRAGALSITLHLIQLITMVSQELYLALTPNLRILRKKSYQGYNRHRDIHEIRPALSLKDRLWTSFSVRCLQYIPSKKMVRCEHWDRD